MSYTEPKWQKMRLEIFQRDDWKCRVCGDDKKEIQVHHLYYLPGFPAWDHDPEGMVTLCKDCHRNLTFELSKLAGIIAFDIYTGKFDPLSGIQNYI